MKNHEFRKLLFDLRQQRRYLTAKQIDVLAEYFQSEQKPDTSDFEDGDWEEVARLQYKGYDHIEALRCVRESIDEENEDD